ncbi:high mobility group B protein 1 [Gastrolobium bilobum]|uniref:high mobility group B protein 1 n=1 Tax=Gastrolobium bilobum TaxID=150636 RepID=UPI002AB28D3F|nr:high mobility group B protein 1 [Gastrolobium bilobum]
MKNAKGKGTLKNIKETLKPVDDRKVGKRKASYKPDKSSARKPEKEKKAKKDPNKPKRPPSAFFVFLEEFRKTFKADNPGVKAVSAVAKAGGEKWKSLTAAEKAPYEAKAAKRKAEYEKLMNAYNKKQQSSADDESDKSKSEVNDEDDEASGEEDHHDDDDDDEDDEEDDDEDDE